MTTILRGHAAFFATYWLLEELWAAGADYGLSWPARAHLAHALVELTDHGRDTPDTPVPAYADDAGHGLDLVDQLLTQMLGEVTDLPSTLRLTRVRELVAQARRAR